MSNSDPSKAIIPDHTIGGGFFPAIHTRYLIDAGCVLAGVSLFIVALFLISEPDIAPMVRKLASAGQDAAAAALI